VAIASGAHRVFLEVRESNAGRRPFIRGWDFRRMDSAGITIGTPGGCTAAFLTVPKERFKVLEWRLSRMLGSGHVELPPNPEVSADDDHGNS